MKNILDKWPPVLALLAFAGIVIAQSQFGGVIVPPSSGGGGGGTVDVTPVILTPTGSAGGSGDITLNQGAGYVFYVHVDRAITMLAPTIVAGKWSTIEFRQTNGGTWPVTWNTNGWGNSFNITPLPVSTNLGEVSFVNVQGSADGTVGYILQTPGFLRN